jgi:osmotically-inducible protein OsmY
LAEYLFKLEGNFMELEHSFTAVFASMMIVSGLVACDKSGPAESAGKKIDEATENVSSAISNTVDKADQSVMRKTDSAVEEIEDGAITAKVKMALLNDANIKSMKITITTERAIVTLTGSVENQDKIDKAVMLTKAVSGVQSVNNKLVISK